MADSIPNLSPIEARVLGTLVEKQRTVPDTYPLSLNALAAGCNQKTSRNPVLDLIEPDILQALGKLKEKGLVTSDTGGRVTRYAHQLEKELAIPKQASALLTVLLLRGPQTAGELRLNCERLHRFADISSVEVFLEELAARPEGALVVELPRLPGSRENRWAHLLCGGPVIEASHIGRASPQVANSELQALKDRVEALESEVAAMRQVLNRLTER